MTDRDSLQDFSGVMCAANEMKELEPTQTEEVSGLNETDGNLPLNKVERTMHLP